MGGHLGVVSREISQARESAYCMLKTCEGPLCPCSSLKDKVHLPICDE
jgi:hypothetical protein